VTYNVFSGALNPTQSTVRTSVTVGVTSSVVNDVIMRTGAASAVGAICHNENDLTITTEMKIWRLATCGAGCTALV